MGGLVSFQMLQRLYILLWTSAAALATGAVAAPQAEASNAPAAPSADDRVGWVSPSDSRRSTWDIIWSCLTVFLICSWKCTHLNIPSVAESRGEWYKVTIGSVAIPLWPTIPTWKKCTRKLGYMALIIVAPEVIVALAVKQYVEARETRKAVTVGSSSRPRYTMAHAYWAKMGGFVLRVYDGPGEYGRRGQYHESGIELSTVQEQEAPLKPAGLSAQAREKVLSLTELATLEDMCMVDVADLDIQDHAKADGFTKLFAVVQAGWLVIQSIARKASGLQITELELMTMAFTMCALVTYILWWDKPFDAERAIIITCPEEKRKEMEAALNIDVTDYRRKDNFSVPDLDLDSLIGFLSDAAEVVDDSVVSKIDLISSCALYASGAAFSAVHLAAWNWVFPQPVAQTVWRALCIAALSTSLLPILASVAIGYVPTGSEVWYFQTLETLITSFLFLMVGTNVLSRLGLVVLTFYCFTLMPASVYSDLDWTRFFPHFS